MRLYKEMIKVYIKMMVQYRYVFMVSFIIDPIVLIIFIALFTTVFSSNNTQTMFGYSLSQMIWYFAATNFIWNFLWNHTDERISNGILTGDIAMNLVRPISILKAELSHAIANRICGITFEFIPSIIVYSLIYFPDFLTFQSFARFLAIILLSFIMLFLINFLIGLTAFFIKNNYSLQAFKSILISISAGAFIPFEFFPDWLQKIVYILPFQFLFYWPIQFFLNKEVTQNVQYFLKTLTSQFIWIILLFCCCRFFWKLSVKRFCSAGG